MKKKLLSILIITMIALCLGACVSNDANETTWRLGDYKGSFVGIRTEKDNEGGTIIYTKFEFTNYSQSPISFEQALQPTVLQNGGELARIDEEIDPTSISVNPGDTHSMDIKYYTQDVKSILEVRITNKFTGEVFSAGTAIE